MAEELLCIYRTGIIDKASLLKNLGYTASQMKADLRVLVQYNIIVYRGTDKSYLLSDSTKTDLGI